MTIDTQKLREAAAGAKEFASVGVVQWPHTAKAHINGLSDTVTTCCGEIDAQAAEIARLRGALKNLLSVYDGTDKQQTPGQFAREARAALSGESNAS